MPERKRTSSSERFESILVGPTSAWKTCRYLATVVAAERVREAEQASRRVPHRLGGHLCVEGGLVAQRVHVVPTERV